MNIPVKHSAASLIVHIVLVFCLLKFSNLGIYAIVFGNASFPLIIFILNFISLYRYIDYKPDYIQIFLKPVICSAIMGVAIALVYNGLYAATESNIISLFAAFAAAAVSYFGSFYICKRIEKNIRIWG
jgi:stage V sporulation protein B